MKLVILVDMDSEDTASMVAMAGAMVDMEATAYAMEDMATAEDTVMEGDTAAITRKLLSYAMYM